MLHAQDEHWDTYMASYGGKPGSVLVDMGAVTTAPDKALPYLLITGPAALDCNAEKGIPPPGAIDDMEQVLDVTSAMLSGVTAKKLVGTFTHNCERLNYYYVKDTAAIRFALARMYRDHFKDYRYVLRIKPDAEWLTYRTFLYPDSAAKAWMAADKTITGLLQSGDDLSAPRAIRYTLCFHTENERSIFADSCIKQGFTIAGQQNTSALKTMYEITVSKVAAVKMDSILADEARLSLIAAGNHGYYIKWEAPLPH